MDSATGEILGEATAHRLRACIGSPLIAGLVFERFVGLNERFARGAGQFARSSTRSARPVGPRANAHTRFTDGIGWFPRCIKRFAGCIARFARGVARFARGLAWFARCAGRFARCIERFASRFKGLTRVVEGFPRVRGSLSRHAERPTRGRGWLISFAASISPADGGIPPAAGASAPIRIFFAGAWGPARAAGPTAGQDRAASAKAGPTPA